MPGGTVVTQKWLHACGVISCREYRPMSEGKGLRETVCEQEASHQTLLQGGKCGTMHCNVQACGNEVVEKQDLNIS